jgi:hypothetical protein
MTMGVNQQQNASSTRLDSRELFDPMYQSKQCCSTILTSKNIIIHANAVELIHPLHVDENEEHAGGRVCARTTTAPKSVNELRADNT